MHIGLEIGERVFLHERRTVPGVATTRLIDEHSPFIVHVSPRTPPRWTADFR